MELGFVVILATVCHRESAFQGSATPRECRQQLGHSANFNAREEGRQQGLPEQGPGREGELEEFVNVHEKFDKERAISLRKRGTGTHTVYECRAHLLVDGYRGGGGMAAGVAGGFRDTLGPLLAG